jgi:hypothetical protein
VLRHAEVTPVVVQPTGELPVLRLEVEESAPVGAGCRAAELLDDPDVLVNRRDDMQRTQQVVRLDQDQADTFKVLDRMGVFNRGS